MKSLVGKSKSMLFNKKGEMLMEAIVSVMLLSILLVIITTMIQTSRNVTANSMGDAREFQQELFNLTILAYDDDDPEFDESDFVEIESGEISFHLPWAALPAGVEIEHSINIYVSNGIRIAFLPDP
jgi:competence protein ComGC